MDDRPTAKEGPFVRVSSMSEQCARVGLGEQQSPWLESQYQLPAPCAPVSSFLAQPTVGNCYYFHLTGSKKTDMKPEKWMSDSREGSITDSPLDVPELGLRSVSSKNTASKSSPKINATMLQSFGRRKKKVARRRWVDGQPVTNVSPRRHFL